MSAWSRSPINKSRPRKDNRTTLFASELNAQNMHQIGTAVPGHTQLLETQPEQEEELELEPAEALGLKNVPVVACFMRLAAGSLLGSGQ